MELDRRSCLGDSLRWPRLRPVEAREGMDPSNRLIVLFDPSEVAPAPVALSPAALAIASRFDGARSIEEIELDVLRAQGGPSAREVIEQVAGELDRCCLLESPTFYSRLDELTAEYRMLPRRPARLAGESYPGTAEELTAYLKSFRMEDASDVVASPSTHGLLVPHIDYQRGGRVYEQAYRHAEEAAREAELIVVLGVDHRGPIDSPFTLTRLDYETPLGPVGTDRGVVDWLASEVGDWVFEGELAHAGEHSVEFQAVWLEHLLGDRSPPIKIVPILCGSFAKLIETGLPPRKDDRICRFIDALIELREQRRCFFVAAGDLAHVGQAFGDEGPLQGGGRDQLREEDAELLDAAAEGSSESVFSTVQREGDRRRICGLPPLYAMLSALGGDSRGRLLAYEQCEADSEKTSWVSVAAMSFKSAIGLLLLLLAASMGSPTSAYADAPPAPDGPPAPLGLQVTPFALTPLPFEADARAWVSVAGGSMDEWRRLRADYVQSTYTHLRVGAMDGRDLPFKIPYRASYGFEMTLLSAVGLEVDLPPAIHESHEAVGLGNTRLFVAAEVLDTRRMKWKLAGFRLRASVFFRATAPTSTTMGRKERYPLLAWKQVLGPAADDYNAAILEMGGLGAVASRWDDDLALQLHWTPVVWGVVAGGEDRFLTHLHLIASGRPSPYLEIVAETYGLVAYDDLRYGAEVEAGGVGLGLRGLIYPWTVEAGFRYGFGDVSYTYGQWVVGARASFALNSLF